MFKTDLYNIFKIAQDKQTNKKPYSYPRDWVQISGIQKYFLIFMVGSGLLNFSLLYCGEWIIAKAREIQQICMQQYFHRLICSKEDKILQKNCQRFKCVCIYIHIYIFIVYTQHIYIYIYIIAEIMESEIQLYLLYCV